MKKGFLCGFLLLSLMGCKIEEETIIVQEEIEEVTMKEEEMVLYIDETKVEVEWEDNASVDALKELCKDSTITIQMSMYGGFEQVGSLGTTLVREDVQTVTNYGDIVLYSGNQIVIFYGSNSWAYTRLGHIVDQDEKGMEELLGKKDVVVTIFLEEK